jgi:hypothetical protein
LRLRLAANGGDGWQVGILSATLNANAAIQGANPRNPTPAAGQQFLLARMHITRTDATPATFNGSLQLIGSANVAYAPSAACGTIPDPLPRPQLVRGSTAIGNVCWQVPAAEVDSLVLFYTTQNEPVQRIYFALR